MKAVTCRTEGSGLVGRLVVCVSARELGASVVRPGPVIVENAGSCEGEVTVLTSSQEHAQGAVLELVQRVVVALVDRPELVRVTRISGERAVVIEVAAVPPEVGQIIGRGGRNIHALQAIAQAVAAKHGVECQIVVLDRPREGDTVPPPAPPRRFL